MKGKKQKKKKYQPPSIESKDIYAVNALGCGKCAGNNPIKQSACLQNKKFS